MEEILILLGNCQRYTKWHIIALEKVERLVTELKPECKLQTFVLEQGRNYAEILMSMENINKTLADLRMHNLAPLNMLSDVEGQA